MASWQSTWVPAADRTSLLHPGQLRRCSIPIYWPPLNPMKFMTCCWFVLHNANRNISISSCDIANTPSSSWSFLLKLVSLHAISSHCSSVIQRRLRSKSTKPKSVSMSSRNVWRWLLNLSYKLIVSMSSVVQKIQCDVIADILHSNRNPTKLDQRSDS